MLFAPITQQINGSWWLPLAISVTVVGASGCGKSTPLNIIAGLSQPSSGEVRVDNEDLWKQTHTTIFMITHDVEEAVFLSQRIYVMSAHPGQIKEEIAIALPDHRDVEVKLEREFMEMKRQVMYALRDG